MISTGIKPPIGNSMPEYVGDFLFCAWTPLLCKVSPTHSPWYRRHIKHQKQNLLYENNRKSVSPMAGFSSTTDFCRHLGKPESKGKISWKYLLLFFGRRIVVVAVVHTCIYDNPPSHLRLLPLPHSLFIQRFSSNSPITDDFQHTQKTLTHTPAHTRSLARSISLSSYISHFLNVVGIHATHHGSVNRCVVVGFTSMLLCLSNY